MGGKRSKEDPSETTMPESAGEEEPVQCTRQTERKWWAGLQKLHRKRQTRNYKQRQENISSARASLQGRANITQNKYMKMKFYNKVYESKTIHWYIGHKNLLKFLHQIVVYLPFSHFARGGCMIPRHPVFALVQSPLD